MSGETLTLSEVLALPEETDNTSNVQILKDNGDIEPPKVGIGSSFSSYIPTEQKHEFVNRMGTDLFSWARDTALVVSGAAIGGMADVNDFFGHIAKSVGQMGGLSMEAEIASQVWKSNYVEPGRDLEKRAFEALSPTGIFERNYYEFIRSLGHLMTSLPFDVMLGQATKWVLAGEVLPAVGEALSKIPDFALGTAWKGLVEGVSEAETLIQGVGQGIRQAGENMGFAMLYAASGAGIQGIVKMSVLGVANSVYEAAKQDRLPSKQEMIDGGIQGTAMGVAFAMVPAFLEATKIPGEKKVLQGYQDRLNKVIEGEKFKKGSLEEVSRVTTDILKDDRIRMQVRKGLADALMHIQNQGKEIVPPDLVLANWKDKGILSQRLNTLERNIEKIAPKQDAEIVKNFLTEQVKINETQKARWERGLRAEVESKIKEWNIKPESQQDKDIQRYGEGNITLDQVKTRHPKDWSTIVTASKWFRGQYDQLLDTVNTVRESYDYAPIPKRQDYFRHFQELSAFSRVFGFLVSKQGTAKAGIKNKMESGKPFSTIELKRLGEKTSESAIRGYNNYLDSAGNQIFHTDSVQRAKELERYIRNQAETNDEIDLANFVTNLRDQVDVLRGVPLDVDKSVKNFIGPKAYGLLRWLERRTSANMIGYNIASGLNNFIPFTQSFATTGKFSALKGLFTSALTPFNKHSFSVEGVESEFFLRRFPKKDIEGEFVRRESGFIGVYAGGEKTYALQRFVDQFAVKAIIAGKYFEGRNKKLPPDKAMREADNYAERIVQDRSWGQLPIAMEAKSLRTFSQFQVEVLNMVNWLQHDVPRMSEGNALKMVGALSQFSVYSFLMNNIAENVFGRRVTIDSIYFFGTLMGWTKQGIDREFEDRLYPAIVEGAGSLPFGNIALPGGRFPISAGIPDLERLTTGTTGQKVTESLRPVMYYASPAGGGQLKKSVEGTRDYMRGYSETPGGNVRYEIDQDLTNFMRGFMFGKNAFPESVDYWRMPVSER